MSLRRSARFGAGRTIRNHADDLLLEVQEYTARCVEPSHSARNATMLGERGMQSVEVTLYFIQGPLISWSKVAHG